MPQFVYTMKGLGKIHEPDHQVLRDIWLSFLPGAKIGVLGLNGSGKSTLLRIMAGLDTHFNGEAFPGEGVSVGFLPQEPQLDPVKDVRGNVEEGVAEIRALLDRYDAVNMKLGEEMTPEAMDKVLDEQSRLQDRIDATNAWDLDSRLEMAMDSLRLPPPDASPATLSGGERRRVALCRLLLQSPDLLLLDEPTNHLDAESVAWLERFLKDYPGTVVAVTHDRYFLDNVAGWILELDRGHGIPYQGIYPGWLEQKQGRLAQEEKTESKRQRTLQRELDWIRMSPRARQAKGKARLNAYEQLLAEDTGEKLDKVEIYIPPGPRLGDIVVEARGVKKAYGDNLLFDDLTFTLPRGGIVGVIGPNGAGKTTLFNLLTGFDQPNTGTWSFNGRSLGSLAPHQVARLGVVRTFQLTKALSRLTVLQNMLLGAQGQKGESFFRALVPGTWRAQERANTEKAMDLLTRFKLDRKKDDFAGTLSGGQRKLLEMARALMSDPKVVMLDEPMAGVNPALTQSLLGHVKDLREQGMTVVFVEHDMDVVRDISDWVVVMAAGKVIAEGPPESISQNQAVVDAYLGAHHDAPLTVEEEDRVLAEAEAAIAREENAEGDVIGSETRREEDR
jgi:ATP-binding cassette ChvD family protein